MESRPSHRADPGPGQFDPVPELNLLASGGFNGLGTSVDGSWDDVSEGNYPVWSLGLEFRIPIGNQPAKSELAAARLRQRQEELALRNVEREIGSSLDNAVSRIRAAAQAVEGFSLAEAANRKLLESELESLEAGRGSVRRVLEAEDGLFEASVTLLRSTVQKERARLELALFQGTVLERAGAELSPSELREQIGAIGDGEGWSQERYERFLRSYRDDSGL